MTSAELPRDLTRPVSVGGVSVGGGAPVAVQSMTNTDTGDAEATLAQIGRLAKAGCEIIRCAVPNEGVLESFSRICEESPLPVVADIHFDHRLAIESARRGASGLRINPGNVGSFDRVDQVIDVAGELGVPITRGLSRASMPSVTICRSPRSSLPAASRSWSTLTRGASRTSYFPPRRTTSTPPCVPTECCPPSCPKFRCTWA